LQHDARCLSKQRQMQRVLGFLGKKECLRPHNCPRLGLAAAMGVSEARINVESINYLRTLTAPFPLSLMLIKWSGCAWPACRRLIALCNSLQLPVLAVMHDFRDVFTPIVQEPEPGARYSFCPSNALSSKL
jgi:hypothetical protein